ncbi:T9SS type A sorting domain-containing protein [Parasediminibacterium sp. JCM 36343]|uniref:T9SS type A sorting domain-containing protein n=1 Tax=Parasediminibacterium sp. JCM 36343 TaxID=3374279 RepID=UPI003979C77A
MRTLKPATTLFLLLSIVSSPFFSKAQPWMQPFKNSNPTFQQMKQAGDAYFATTKGKENKKLYNRYKQWEWQNQGRVLPNGTIASQFLTQMEREKYTASHPTANNKIVAFGTNTPFGTVTPTGNWASKGPFTDNGGGYIGAGRLNAIAFHPTLPNTFWVGAPAGGLWKTTDGGTTWSSSTDSLPVIGISAIVVDSTNPNILYVATGDGDGSDTKGIGIYKSTDGGNTWKVTGLSATQDNPIYVFRLIINPKNHNTLLAATSHGVYNSYNAGASWIRSAAKNSYNKVTDITYKPLDSTTAYACYQDFNFTTNTWEWKIIRSKNGGKTWSVVNTFTDASRVSLAVSADSSNVVEALVASSSYALAGIWRSRDGGSTFSQYLDGTLPFKNYLSNTYDASGADGQGFYDLAFTINPKNFNEKWIGGVNTWHTIDNGLTWQLNNIWVHNFNTPKVPEVHADKHAFAYHPLLSNTFFECNDGGLYKTTDKGATWTDLSNGLVISEMYKISAAQYRANMVLCGLQDNGTKGWDGSTWNNITGGDGTQCIIDNVNTNIIYTGYVQGVIYRDSFYTKPLVLGKPFYQNTISNNIPVDPNIPETGAWVTPVAMDAKATSTLYTGYSRVYKTTNGGYDWKAISPYLTSYTINKLAVAPSNSNYIWATNTGDSLFYTNDGGNTWSNLPATTISNTTISNSIISYIAFNATNPNIVWVTFSGYDAGLKVFKTTNGGISWVNMSGTLPNLPVNCIVLAKSASDTAYVGTDMGVFYRDAGMTDWALYNTGLPHVPVKHLDISYSNRKLYAGTFGRGLWVSDLYATLLPLSFLSFTALQSGDGVSLKWQTTAEVNTSKFIVEKSIDGTNWQQLDTVKAKNIAGTNGYTALDKFPAAGINYYRVKSIDVDGGYTYSKIASVNIEAPIALSIVPNPASFSTTLRFKEPVSEAAITVFNVAGQKVMADAFSGLARKSYLLATNSLANGTYFVQIKTTTASYSARLIVAK